MNNEYYQDFTVSDKFVIPRRGYHKEYVRQSKIRHVIFALVVVALLVYASLLLSGH